MAVYVFSALQPMTLSAPPTAPSEYMAVGIERTPVAKMTLRQIRQHSDNRQRWSYLQKDYRGSKPSDSPKVDALICLLEHLIIFKSASNDLFGVLDYACLRGTFGYRRLFCHIRRHICLRGTMADTTAVVVFTLLLTYSRTVYNALG